LTAEVVNKKFMHHEKYRVNYSHLTLNLGSKNEECDNTHLFSYTALWCYKTMY